MAKTNKTVPDEWTPAKPDEYTGLGGSYVYDPETGARWPAPAEEQQKVED